MKYLREQLFILEYIKFEGDIILAIEVDICIRDLPPSISDVKFNLNLREYVINIISRFLENKIISVSLSLAN